MKNILFSLVIIFGLCSNAYSALPAGGEWDVRTTGASTNGGCYDFANDGGTDYSQQDAAQYAPTDIDQASASDITITSATAGFTAAMVDNCIQIVSGTNAVPGFYEIVTYNSTSSVDLDRFPDDGTALTGDTVGNVGGALDTIDAAYSNAVANNHIHVKSGTYDESVAGNTLSPMQMSGFLSTHGDGPTGTDRPVNDRGGVGADPFLFGQENIIVRNMRSHDSTTDGFSTVNDSTIRLQTYVNCSSTNHDSDGYSSQGSSKYKLYFQSYAGNNTAYGFNGGQAFGSTSESNGDGLNAVTGFWNQINSNTGDGNVEGRQAQMHFSLFYENGDDASVVNNVTLGYGMFVYAGNTFSDNTGDAYSHSGGTYQDYRTRPKYNNIFYSNLTDQNGATTLFRTPVAYTNTNSNTSQNLILNTLVEHVTSDITTDPSFTSEATDDYTLSTGSGAIGTGILSTFPGHSFDFNWNIGVDQGDHTVGGAAATTGHAFVGN